MRMTYVESCNGSLVGEGPWDVALAVCALCKVARIL